MILALGELLCLGYLVLGRSFAYLGIVPFYPAEVYILLATVTNPGRWLQLLAQNLAQLRAISVWMILFFAWGCVECARALPGGGAFWPALRGLATHYYPFLLFLGIGLAQVAPAERFMGLIRRACIVTGVYGLLYAAFFSRVEAILPWTEEVPVFGTLAIPPFGVLALLVLAPFTGRMVMLVGVLDLLAVLANPGRASWLSLGVGCALIASGGLRRRVILRGSAIVAAVVVILYLVGPLLPAAEGRGGVVTYTWLVARIIATVDPGAAFDLLAQKGSLEDANKVYAIAGTGNWRMTLWERLVGSLSSTSLLIAGHGYGVSLSDLVGDIVGYDEDLRSPHNFALYLLGYTGFVGLLLFTGLIGSFLLTILRLQASSHKTFLLSFLGCVLTLALFGNALETPFVAVPFYLLTGWAFGIASGRAGGDAGPGARVGRQP